MITKKPVKIDVNQIASWRSGDTISQQKLEEVFSLIGTAINRNADSALGLLQDLSELAIPKRWLGESPTFAGIDALVSSLNLLPEFQDDPSPESGDCLYVVDNSDDPNLPSYNPPGKYMYVYVETYIENVQLSGWTMYMRVFDPTKDPIERATLADKAILAETADKILDPVALIYRYINEFSIETWGGLTEEQIFNVVSASGSVFRLDYIYRKDFIVMFVTPATNLLSWAISLIDNNIGNNPWESPLAWKVLAGAPIDIDTIIEQLRPFITSEVNRVVDELPDITIGTSLTISAEGVLDMNTAILDDTYLDKNTIIQQEVQASLYLHTGMVVKSGSSVNIASPIRLSTGAILFMGDEQIKQLAPGVAETDAVNMGQFTPTKDSAAKNTLDITNLMNALDGKVVVPGVIENGQLDANGVIALKYNDLANIVVRVNKNSALHSICSPDAIDYQRTRCSSFASNGAITPWGGLTVWYQKWVILKVADLPAHNIKVEESRIRMEKMSGEKKRSIWRKWN